MLRNRDLALLRFSQNSPIPTRVELGNDSDLICWHYNLVHC